MAMSATIPYHVQVPARGGNSSIRVVCPECGEWGRLIRARTGVHGRLYKVYHTDKSCSFTPRHPAQPALDAIYRAVREVSHDGL